MSGYTAEQAEEFEPGPCGACGDSDTRVEWIDVASHDDRDAWIPRVVCVCGAVNDSGYWRYPR